MGSWSALYFRGELPEGFRPEVATAPLAHVEGRATSKLTHTARFTLLAGVASLVGLALSRDGGFAGLAAVCLLVAFGAGYLRRINLGRWFL